jgi:hypothetical protein
MRGRGGLPQQEIGAACLERMNAWLLGAGLAILAWILSLDMAAYAQSKQAAQSEVIVSVGGKKITRKELDEAVRERVPQNYEVRGNLQVPSMVLKSLVLETLADNIMTPTEIAKIPHLASRLENTRRDILVRALVDSQIKVEPPTEETVKKYIASHPHFYQDRKTYHFGELIISAKSQQTAAAVRDRLKRLIEMKQPDLESAQMVVQWLAQNHIEYGYVTAWKATDNLLPAIAPIVMGMEKKEIKVDVDDKIDGAGTAFRVVILFDVHPDAINPTFARNLTAQRLMNDERDRQTTQVIQKILAQGRVLLHDKKYSSANLPATLAPPLAQGSLSEPALKMNVIFTVALLSLLPVALYQFFRQRPLLPDGEPFGLADVVTNYLAFRIAFVAIVGSALAAMAAGILIGEFENTNLQYFVRSALAGAILGIAVALLFAKVKTLNVLIADRWAAISAVAVAQVALMFVYEGRLM